MSGIVNDFDLVKFVEAYPILYDKDLARCQKHAKKKDEAWRVISSQLKASERACITRWKSIRDRFGKEFRRVQKNPDEPTNWDLFPHLLFLQNHYKLGNVANEQITVKYEPRTRKRKLSKTIAGQDNAADTTDNVKGEELTKNQQLIALVKEHPVLYHKQYIRDSRNILAKNAAWQKISEAVCISEEICYKLWKKLRERFAREYRYHQLRPNEPVTWAYFQDLMFLESHYRKGIPLPVDQMRDRLASERNSLNSTDSYPLEEDNFGLNTNNDDEDLCNENPTHTSDVFVPMDAHALDELLVNLPNRKFDTLEYADNGNNSVISQQQQQSSNMACSIVQVKPEDQLKNVISNMESVLKQAQNCLQNIQEEKNSNVATSTEQTKPLLLQRMDILLDGLSAEQRRLAERKIYQFVCESQIKSMNNELVDDVIDKDVT